MGTELRPSCADRAIFAAAAAQACRGCSWSGRSRSDGGAALPSCRPPLPSCRPPPPSQQQRASPRLGQLWQRPVVTSGALSCPGCAARPCSLHHRRMIGPSAAMQVPQPVRCMPHLVLKAHARSCSEAGKGAGAPAGPQAERPQRYLRVGHCVLGVWFGRPGVPERRPNAARPPCSRPGPARLFWLAACIAALAGAHPMSGRRMDPSCIRRWAAGAPRCSTGVRQRRGGRGRPAASKSFSSVTHADILFTVFHPSVLARVTIYKEIGA